MLNSKQVDQLFQQNAVLFGSRDGVPEYRVTELFGEAAANFSIRLNRNGGNHSVYGTGDYGVPYFTYNGFQVAATYTNIQEVKMQESAKTKAKELGLTVVKKKARA